MKDSEIMREENKKNIQEIQEENRKICDKKRKRPHVYKRDDLVAIQRTQFRNELKMRPKFHGLYEVTKMKSHARYDVKKVGNHEGPINVSTDHAADRIKPWAKD